MALTESKAIAALLVVFYELPLSMLAATAEAATERSFLIGNTFNL